MITASHIETVRQVRHVTPPTVGREEILSHELGGGERHTGGNAVTRLVTKRRNVGITALSGSEYFRRAATCSHAQYIIRKKRSKNKNIFHTILNVDKEAKKQESELFLDTHECFLKVLPLSVLYPQIWTTWCGDIFQVLIPVLIKQSVEYSQYKS